MLIEQFQFVGQLLLLKHMCKEHELLGVDWHWL